MEGRESILTYSDKKGLNLTLNKRFGEFVKKAHADRIKSLIDVRGGIVVLIGIFAILVGIDVILGENGKGAIFSILKTVLSLALMLMLAKIMVGSKAEET